MFCMIFFPHYRIQHIVIAHRGWLIIAIAIYSEDSPTLDIQTIYHSHIVDVYEWMTE